MRTNEALISTVANDPMRNVLELMDIISVNNRWMSEGLCAQIGGDEWFPPAGEKGTDAKKMCRLCPIREKCLTFALDAEPRVEGIWGGTNERERQALRKEAA